MPKTKPPAPLTTPGFRRALLSWYDLHKRDLPFRRTRNAYHIWLSEIMLQQTTVAAVLDYYRRFLEKLPDPKAVARASEAELLTLWQGLGYYSRARNFKKACEIVVARHGGKVPRSYAALRELPGVGDYTAAAVSSIAFGAPHAVVDGNVQRVLARLFAFKEEISSKEAKFFFRETADALLDPERPGDYNQALMELGATVCRPRSPSCALCPVGGLCASRDKNPESLPLKRKMTFVEKNYAALLLTRGEEILLEPPGEKSLVAGLWELPLTDGEGRPRWENVIRKSLPIKDLKPIGRVKHGITNKKITASVYRHTADLKPLPPHRFVPLGELERLPLGTLTRKILGKFLRSDRVSL